MTPPKMSRRHKLFAAAPALLVIGITTITASGLSVISGANAASTVTVSGSVAAAMSISPDTNTASCGLGSLGIGDFSGGAFTQTGATCLVQFATNSVNGAYLAIDDSNAAPFFCTATCTATSNDAVENATSAAGGSALGNDQFGAALIGVAGTPAPVAGTNFELDLSPGTQTGAETIWGPVDAALARVCETTAVTSVTQSCTMTFAADGQGATQTAGAYSGTANVLATANP